MKFTDNSNERETAYNFILATRCVLITVYLERD